ncbi:MAG: 4Fe-4S dicluster domain-containing protein, partial [Syntrophorhabdaceae bacterium]
TAANADHWLSVPVGGERFIALGLLNLVAGASPGRSGIAGDISAVTPRVVEERTGVKAETLKIIAQHFSRATRPLALAEGMGFQDPAALETAVAANILCTLIPGSQQLLDFSQPLSLGETAYASDIKEITGRMADGQVGALILYRANPVYSLPAGWAFESALRKVPLVINFSSFPDETTYLSSLIMPVNTFLESWGDYSPQAHVTGLLQPAMGRLFDTRQLGDILLLTGKGAAGNELFPEKDFYEVLRASWEKKRKENGADASPNADWQQSLALGGVFTQGKAQTPPKVNNKKFFFSAPADSLKKPTGFTFITYPAIRFFDGHLANRPVLQETPDPVTMITWDGWVEIDPEMAETLGIRKGDIVDIHAAERTIRAPAFPYAGIPAGTLAMPIGYGHNPDFSRYAPSGEAGNPKDLSSGELDAAGGLVRVVSGVTLTKTGRNVPVASADGNTYQHGRKLARDISLTRYALTSGGKPDIDMPLPEGWDNRRDFYPAHHHVAYRWGMVIDLDRCIGCQACVVACYMENNVGIVGKKNVLLGRQMSWIHIERYYEPDQPYVRFLPMLCQHCDNAPCESVCPLFAPQHNPEGINNQVYNRCIGTRDCNVNCPWKVRRFNWFTWQHDYPLGWQLNPDVTVRQKGVMEKCSFCIQRVVHAKTVATSQGRKIKDGEFTTACAQTCPADAIVFGNLMDPESKVSKLLNQARAYQVLGKLNTKPAVIYLKKITQEL